jgi:hypothetical protein
MDASKITELLQKQNTVYINRRNTVDSSTMIWRNQIQSSKYIKGVTTCSGLQNTDVPTQAVCPNGDGTFSFGGRGKGTALATGSSQHFLNVYSAAAGSASEVYSSDKILLQKAGRQYCAELITDQDAYTILPKCTTVNTNGPTSDNPNPAINNQDTNPYLPPFDTHYKFKNPQPPIIDQNQKHYVQYCNGCVIEPVVTRYGWPLLMVGVGSEARIISNSVTYNGDSVFAVGTFRGTIRAYDGTPVQHSPDDHPTIMFTSVTDNLDAFIIKYDQTGKIQWYTTIQTTTGTQTTAYSVAVDTTGIYVSGYMDGPINIYNGITRVDNMVYGPIVSSLTPVNPALFVVKYDLTGYFLWSTMVDGIMSQAGPAGPQIQPTNMSQVCINGNNVYLCNSIDSTIATVSVYGSNGLVALTLNNEGNGDSQQAFLVQYNATTGMTNWATRMTGSTVASYPGTTNATGLVCDANNVYITGYYNNTANYYNAVTPASPAFGASQAVITNGINNGMYIAAYSKTGAFQWVNTGNINSFSFISMGIQLTVDATGVYVIVPFPNAISFNTNPQPPGGGTSIQLINTGGANTYNIGIVKYSLTGYLTWINKILNVDNGSGNVATNGFSLSSDGSALYVTGGFGQNTIGLYNSSTTGDPTPQAATLSTAGGTNTHTFLIKYSLLGALQWSTFIGRSGSFANGFDVATNTNLIYLTGAANGSVDLYNSNGLSQPTSIGRSLIPGAGLYYYAYVAKYDYNGQVALG